MSEQLGLVFLVLFVFAAAACIYSNITMSRRVQAGINRWRNEERQALEIQLRQLADADARVQIERWKQQHEQEIRLDAVQCSSAITRGKVTGAHRAIPAGLRSRPQGHSFSWHSNRPHCVQGDSVLLSKKSKSHSLRSRQAGSVLSARERAVKKAVEQKRVSCRPSRSDPLRRLLEPRR